MKLKIAVTVELTKEQVRDLVTLAKSSGHGFDGTKAPGKLIRRYLEAKVAGTVAFCHENVSKD